jgi:glyoxylase-like metal-dependent hydrolase (beta-lactamase superfamily II)
MNQLNDTPMNATTQVPFGYRYRVGAMIVTAVTDGHNAMPLTDAFVRNAPLAAVQAALAEACLPQDKLNIPFTPILVHTGGEVVLIDTGYGDNGPPTAGFLPQNMAAAGCMPEDVTKVVISHFHGDHISGLRRKDGKEVFPNAEIWVPEVEWDFWTDPARRAQAPEGMKPAFANVDRVFAPMADRVKRYAWDDEVASGITAIDASGHTPGHTAFVLGSGDERLVFISDVTNHPALFVRNPGWSPAFDMDPEKAVATRRRILGMIASEGLSMAGFHIPYPGVGRILRDGDRYTFVPAQWMQTF